MPGWWATWLISRLNLTTRIKLTDSPKTSKLSGVITLSDHCPPHWEAATCPVKLIQWTMFLYKLADIYLVQQIECYFLFYPMKFNLILCNLHQHFWLSPPQRLNGFFSSWKDPLSNVSAGTGLPAMAESAGASARYHAQDGHHLGEAIFCGLHAGVACVPCWSIWTKG